MVAAPALAAYDDGLTVMLRRNNMLNT